MQEAKGRGEGETPLRGAQPPPALNSFSSPAAEWSSSLKPPQLKGPRQAGTKGCRIQMVTHPAGNVPPLPVVWP